MVAFVFALVLLFLATFGLLALVVGAAWVGFRGGRTGAGLGRTCGRAWAVSVRNITLVVVGVTLFSAILLINRENELALLGSLLEWVLPGALALCLAIALPTVLTSLIAYNIGAQLRTREAMTAMRSGENERVAPQPD